MTYLVVRIRRNRVLKSMLMLLAVSVIFILAGCGMSDEKKIVGTWYELEETEEGYNVDYDTPLYFFEDGSFSNDDIYGTYVMMDGELFLRDTSGIGIKEIRFSYTFEGDTLSLVREDGDVYRYILEGGTYEGVTATAED